MRCGLGWMAGMVLTIATCTPDQRDTFTPPADATIADTLTTPALLPVTPALALTPTEYNNTVRDLFAMPLDPEAWPDPPAIIDSLLRDDWHLEK